jgi:hypothetical protein
MISPEISGFVEIRKYKCITQKYAPESFGNAYVILAGADFDLYLLRDRSVVSLMIAPVGYAKEYFDSLMNLRKSLTVNVLEWQSLGAKWVPVEYVFEFLGIAGLEIVNRDNFGAEIVRRLDKNYSNISDFMRVGLNSPDFAGFVEQKKSQITGNFPAES